MSTSFNSHNGFLGNLISSQYHLGNLGYLANKFSSGDSSGYSENNINLINNFFNNYYLIIRLINLDVLNNFYERFSNLSIEYFFDNYNINEEFFTKFTDELWNDPQFEEINYLLNSIIHSGITIEGQDIFSDILEPNFYIVNFNKYDSSQLNSDSAKILNLKVEPDNDFLDDYHNFIKMLEILILKKLII